MGNLVLQDLELQGSIPNPDIQASKTSSNGDSIFLAGPNPFTYNNHNESIFDDCRYFPGLRRDQESVVKFDKDNEDFINHATLKALVVQLTSPEVIDYNLICDFFLTYRMFSDANTVMSLLLTRLIWSLQYINSDSEDTRHIGKLVLLRTFVVLRHWILNYFIDDFESDPVIGDVFATILNKLVKESNLIHEDSVYEKKIISDLKTHWLSQVDEFYKLGFSNSDKDIFTFQLPMMSDLSKSKKIPKSTTEASIHTNPSFRRSAMLSLYDQRAHHKCLIYDESINNSENPQLSINNLLSQHKSSRTSLNDKLTEFQGKNGKKVLRRPLAPSNNANVIKHNYKNLTDSSLGLKKTANPANMDMPERLTGDDSNQLVPSGFSTNGHVKLPTLKVSNITPSTPAKKMDVTLKENNPGSPSRKPSHSPTLPSDMEDVNRKTSIKKLVDGWKKSFTAVDPRSSISKLPSASSISTNMAGLHESKNSPSVDEIGNRVDILSARIIDELEYLISYYISDQKNAICENEAKDDISGSEIEIENPEGDEFVEVHLDEADDAEGDNSMEKAQGESPDDVQDDSNNNDNQNDLSMQEIPDLSIDRIDNFFYKNNFDMPEKKETETNNATEAPAAEAQPVEDNSNNTHIAQASKRSSFGRVTSINWNDAGGLNFENSDQLDESLTNDESFKEDAMRAERIIKSNTQYFDVSSELPVPPIMAANDSNLQQNSSTSFSTPSDIDDYKANIVDLGLAASPQSLRRSVTFRKNSTHEQLNMTFSKRFSLASGASGSAKSYISYDSAFSISPNHENLREEQGDLKKKSGHQDLRKLAAQKSKKASTSDSEDILATAVHPWRLSLLSQMSASTQRKSIRVSTLRALTELPFNDRTKSSFSSMPYDSQSRSARLSCFGDRSIFSQSGRSGDRDQKSGNHTTNDDTSSKSVAIPGISSYVLKELAAIPDESFSYGNPVQSALSRLEGKGRLIEQKEAEDAAQSLTAELVSVASSDESNSMNTKGTMDMRPVSESTQNHKPDGGVDDNDVNDTEHILDEINNAATEDVIDYSSDVEKELKERPLTPIMTRVRSAIQMSKSTPTFTGFTSSNNNSSEGSSPFMLMTPRAVLERYSLAAKHLSIERVMKDQSHISFLLNYSSRSLAEHFTLIEKDMLQDIDWKELIELKWNKELTPVNSWLEIIVNENYFVENKGVNLVIARFNLTVNWVISEILLTSKLEERIAIISRFIHVAHHCLVLQNFSTLMQIVLALTSEKVTKLKETWKSLPPGDILTLKNLEDLTSPFKNFINIRLCINQIKPSKGCIPFVGLYLSDLIFNAERPRYVKRPANTKTSGDQLKPAPPPNVSTGETSLEKSVTVEDSTEGGDMIGEENEKFINFSRFRTSVHIVKSLSQSIEWSRHYDFAVDEEMLRKCLYLKSLDEDEMNYCLPVDKMVQLQE